LEARDPHGKPVPLPRPPLRELAKKLVALPDEHVKIVGPDGRVRWLFVARPIDAPDLDPLDLN
jgi:hypothetical protein